MAIITKTLHPLPFEHLDAKRFEDLVRQLAYDFRHWRSLEALGQAGGDAGFDARGFEILAPQSEQTDLDDEEFPSPNSDRVWLIQCKREQAIGPSKLLQYLEAIPKESVTGLYGMIFAASSKFSKASNDAFKTWARTNGLEECHLWGRPEIEDALYQPKNDHLLFAYFGLSLQVRRRKQVADLKRTISLRRTLARVFPQDRLFGKPAVLRDQDDERYPVVDNDRFEDAKPLWLPTHVLGIGTRGLQVAVRRHLAYYNYENSSWDFASKINEAIPHQHENPWHDQQVTDERRALSYELLEDWRSFNDGNQHHLVFVATIPYDEILAVDDVPDSFIRVPTVFTKFKDGKPPFNPRWDLFFHAVGYGGRHSFHSEGHVRVFHDKFRDTAWEKDWFRRNDMKYSETLIDVPRKSDGDVAV